MERSTFEEMHAAYSLQISSNRGMPPDLSPVFAQHGWTGPDFYAELQASQAGPIDISIPQALTPAQLQALTNGY